MSNLSLNILLRERETASSIVAVALLVAILASFNSIVNHIEAQEGALRESVHEVGYYMVLSESSKSFTDGDIDAEIPRLLSNFGQIMHVFPQRIFRANLIKGCENHTVQVRGIEEVDNFLARRGTHVNETKANGWAEGHIGVILAEITSINPGDEVSLMVNGSVLKIKVVGVHRTGTQIDSELILHLEAASQLVKSNKLSFIEFTLKHDVDRDEALKRIATILPSEVKLIKVQKAERFLREVNRQILGLINMLSFSVYAVVATASYVITTKLIVEKSYEISMLKALGASRRHLLALVLTLTIIIGLLASLLGISLGVVGTQASSTVLKWMKWGIELTPFLEADQMVRIVLFTLASSILGSLNPALKSARIGFRERML